MNVRGVGKGSLPKCGWWEELELTKESTDTPFEFPERTPIDTEAFVNEVGSYIERNSFLLPDFLVVSHNQLRSH